MEGKIHITVIASILLFITLKIHLDTPNLQLKYDIENPKLF